MPPLLIRELTETDAESYVQLRREALLNAPLAFASSPADDRCATAGAVRDYLRSAPKNVIIGAFQPHLIGALGLYRDTALKASHKAHLWGMYVSANHRRQGVASALLEAALRHAKTLAGVTCIQLGVTSAAPEAKRLYERAGFVVWGTEPEAISHESQTVVEYHMVLKLARW
jgi:ribosomal protein S18 acetylase RimI-like enzyme